MRKVKLPKVRNVWVEPKIGSRLRAAVKRLAPNASALVFYPDLPGAGQRIWAVWRNGIFGVAQYQGGWTYQGEDGSFINEMPVAWCPHAT